MPESVPHQLQAIRQSTVQEPGPEVLSKLCPDRGATKQAGGWQPHCAAPQAISACPQRAVPGICSASYESEADDKQERLLPHKTCQRA